MKLPLLSPAESHENQTEDGAIAAIHARLRSAGNGQRHVEDIVALVRTPQPEMARQVLHLANSPSQPSLTEAMPALPAIDEEKSAPEDKPEDELDMNPQRLQAYVDKLAKTTEEGNHDFEETARER